MLEGVETKRVQVGKKNFRVSLQKKNQVSARNRLASLAEKARNYGDAHGGA